VLGIDRFRPPHPMGSTHGDTRITRQAIGEGMAYVPLALRSHELWREIEGLTGADLLTTCGALVLGRPGGSATHGKRDFFGQTVAAAEAFGIAHEVLSADAVRARFPQFRLDGDELGYLEPGAGFLRPEACLSAQLALAESSGATIHTDERMLRLDTAGRGVTVCTTRGRYCAAKVVLSIGAWLPRLLDDSLRPHFGVHRQAMHWFADEPPLSTMTPDRCPVYIWEVGPTQWFYGFPAVDGPGGGVKVATERHDMPTSPDDPHRDVPPAESLALFDGIVGRRLPRLRRERVRAVSCLYTTTDDSDFVIDWHPDSADVLLVSPCSGHGFKHSAAIGEVAAELVTAGRSEIDIDSFSIRRFDTHVVGRSVAAERQHRPIAAARSPR
jgi:sarcosine oxidase